VCCESVFECHGVVRVYLCVMGTHVGRGCTSQRYFRPRVLRRTAFVDVVCVTGMSAYESCSTVRMWRKGERENGVFSMIKQHDKHSKRKERSLTFRRREVLCVVASDVC
jgi:hypothetical protein